MVISYLHLFSGNQYPSIHAICPFGGLENLWVWLSGHSNIQKIFTGTMSLFFLTIIFAFFFRRSFCGNICPFGAIQEFVNKIIPFKLKVPKKIDQILLKFKYLVLLLSAIMAWVTISLWISPYDPWVALSHIFKTDELFGEYLIGFIILVCVLLFSFIINRPFCKYLCPAGALYSIIGKFSLLKIERDSQKCINCEICTKKCPMDIEVHKIDSIKSGECITCDYVLIFAQVQTLQ